jgi:hypothetical protein
MAEIKAGTRLKSAVCNTEVMVIASPGGDVDIRCGGVPMVGANDEKPAGASLDPKHAGGTPLGKRYVNEAGNLEVLCTKPGDGSLSLGESALVLKEAKPLPSSD